MTIGEGQDIIEILFMTTCDSPSYNVDYHKSRTGVYSTELCHNGFLALLFLYALRKRESLSVNVAKKLLKKMFIILIIIFYYFLLFIIFNYLLFIILTLYVTYTKIFAGVILQ